ncbi:hypothetical protein I3842_08G117000 [Carya illinoinensis]|uniref:Uncharacterized protein n=1 Tax=Carya illinoinensis TaxID=32201 RepID=A0A922JA40_CARIL|nr:hypothetical protein I3842_08G117000 [Carya illinoinensis]
MSAWPVFFTSLDPVTGNATRSFATGGSELTVRAPSHPPSRFRALSTWPPRTGTEQAERQSSATSPLA